MTSEVEENKGGIKQKSMKFELQEEGLGGVLDMYPIHNMVMRKIIENLVVGARTVRETIFFVEKNKEEEEEEKGSIRKGDEKEKTMREISIESRGSHAEPIAIVVPIVGTLNLKTYHQYKKIVGRPRKALEHALEVGDMFLLNWRQFHTISWNINADAKNAKWIILAAATKENHLIN
jgi:hypothetical protein